MTDDVLRDLTGHPCHSEATRVLPEFRRATLGHVVSARGCDDGSVELSASGDGWRARVYVDPDPEESGWCVVLRRTIGTPELEVGDLGDLGRLGGLLAAASGHT